MRTCSEQRNKVRGLAHDGNVAKMTLVEVPDRPGVAALVFEPLAEAGINVDMIVQNVGHRRRDRPAVHHPAGRARQGEAAPRADHPRPRFPGDHHRHRGRQGVDRRRRDPERPGLRGADVPDAGRCRGQHRDDLHFRDPDHDDHCRGRARDGPAGVARRVRAGAPRDRIEAAAAG